MRVCIPVEADGAVDPRWGRARRVAVADVDHGVLSEWVVHEVGWDVSHDAAGEGSHHATVARFLREHGVQMVVANHMGPGMVHMLDRLGIAVRLGASGAAREAVLTAAVE